jgi:chromosome segregation ATPase
MPRRKLPPPPPPKRKAEPDERVRRLEDEIAALQLKVVKFMKDAARARDAAERLEARGQAPGADMPLEGIHRRLEKTERALKESRERHEEQLEEIRRSISVLEKRLDDVKDIEAELRKLDLRHLRRDMESLRTKAQWIEQRIENLSLEPLLERLGEMEAAIKTLKLSSPIIVE